VKKVPGTFLLGVFLSDNMLWGGRVVNDASHPATRGVLESARLSFQAPNLYTMILPIRDGVSVSLKLE
jgi:predicted O-methyltransferase YrrM